MAHAHLYACERPRFARGGRGIDFQTRRRAEGGQACFDLQCRHEGGAEWIVPSMDQERTKNATCVHPGHGPHTLELTVPSPAAVVADDPAAAARAHPASLPQDGAGDLEQPQPAMHAATRTAKRTGRAILVCSSPAPTPISPRALPLSQRSEPHTQRTASPFSQPVVSSEFARGDCINTISYLATHDGGAGKRNTKRKVGPEAG